MNIGPFGGFLDLGLWTWWALDLEVYLGLLGAFEGFWRAFGPFGGLWTF